MTVRAVEGKKYYTGGKAIEITEDKVINLRLRDENNLIIWDEGDNEIYVDLQLGDEITPTDTFPVGITTGRAIVDNGWDATGTLVCFKTTSGDNIKLFYTDSGSVFVDNGTGTFKQIYLKSEVDALLATKQNLLTAGDNITIDSNNVISSDKGIVVSNTQPSDATEGLLWYNTVTDQLKVYDGTNWNSIGGGGATYTAGSGINIDVNNEISNTLPFEPTNTGTVGQVLKLDANGDYGWDNESGGGGTGDVVGPSSATDGHLAVFDGTTGKLIKDGGAVPTQVTVVDNLTTQSSTSALSANQGYVLDGKIADLMALGKFLSLWNATTGQPISFPLQTPYTYSTGDYFLVETVSTATPPVNYKPTGSSYTGTASSTTESDELEAGDVYIYDGTTWLLQSNHGKTVSFTNIAGDAMDNVSLSGYLNTKAFYLSSTSDLTTAQAAFEWQNGGKTAIVVYNNKPYMYTSGNAATVSFGCIFYRDQDVLSLGGTGKTNLVMDVITLSLSSGTVTGISAVGWNNIMASVLKTDTDYSNPYTPQYDGSPATKKYVDDKHGVISVTLAAIGWSSKSITVAATGVTATNTVIVSPAPANINDYASNSVYCSAQGSGTLTFSCNTEPTVDIVVNILTIN